MSVEVRGGGGAMMGGGIDPRNLHLKKELSRIRKAERFLRDPGTSSSWRSPIVSGKSLTKHNHKNGQVDGNTMATSSDHLLQFPLQEETNGSFSNGNFAGDKGNPHAKKRERKVFLYNWRQKSESERSRQIGESDVDNGKDDGSSSTQEDSIDVNSLAGAQNGGGNDSKSDTYLSDVFASAIFKFKDTNFTPPVGRKIKKNPNRSNYSSASSRHHKEKLEMRELLSGYARNMVDGLPGLSSAGGDDLPSLVAHSDDTEDYLNFEDLAMTSAVSPLLARLKNKGWTPSTTKLLRSHRKKDDGSVLYTPALPSGSYNVFANRNPSTVESWDAATGSFNDADDEVDDQLDLPGRQGCGIPCYWSKRSTPKSRNGSSCSPSLSDTLRRKGSSIFCGSRTGYQRRYQNSSWSSNKRRLSSKTEARSLIPLLTNSAHGQGASSMGSGNSDDEISTNFEELDLEALSRMDGRRWSSSCRSLENLDVVGLNGEVQEEGSPENMRSLSYKYRPMFFEELIGQNIVVQSLINAVSRRRIAPVYLFHGPRGTGKTSTARIFAAALNCLSNEETKPCGICSGCTDFISGESRYLGEEDGSNKKGIDKIKYLLKNISVIHPATISQYKVFIVDECHLLPSKTWLAFLRLLEKPLSQAVFMLITTDIDNVPRAVLSRCQKHLFSKISNGEIVNRLRKISIEEKFDVESNALELIASNANGSLRDAETMLDQLSLFGKRITKSLVNELIGVVSDEKLLDLLELAMSSNAKETVIKARELIDSGIDPRVLMSQLVALIVDIIAGVHPSSDAQCSDSFFSGRSLTERELDRLKHALTLLSQAEKHLRVASERSTWFTAALLQLCSVPLPNQSHSTSSQRQSSKASEEDNVSMPREAIFHKHTTDAQLRHSPTSFVVASCHNLISQENPVSLNDVVSFNCKPNQRQYIDDESLSVSHDDYRSGRTTLRCMDSEMLVDIWIQCIEKCHSKTLRQLLHSYGKLISIYEVKGGFVAHIAFEDSNVKARADGFISSITNSFEIVLQCNVEVKIILLQDSSGLMLMDKNSMKLENASTCTITGGNSDFDKCCDILKVSRESFNTSAGHWTQLLESVSGNANASTSKDSKSDIPLRRIESIIHEQKLETAWLQAMDKGTRGSMSHLKPERNPVLPEDGIDNTNEMQPMNSLDVPLQHWNDELNHEIKALKINGGMSCQREQIVNRIDHCPISPSLLHSSSLASNFTKDNLGYESGSRPGGCSGMCWKNARRKRKGKAKQVTPIHPTRSRRFSWFGRCAKSRTDSRHGR